MRINQDLCIRCGLCIPYCPSDAIKQSDDSVTIDKEYCVECDVCFRVDVCPVDAIEKTPLEWPRSLRTVFSSVLTEHKETRVPGRGTEEMKTNDVTGRFQYDEVGFSIDVGRPGVGATLGDVEKIATKLAKVGVEFEPLNPITSLMMDKLTGKLINEIKSERIRSAIIEFKVDIEKAPTIIRVLNEVSAKVDTVFSVGIISRVKTDGTIPVKGYLDQLGVKYRPNGKTNIGLGKPA